MLKTIWQLSLYKAKPENIPYSVPLLLCTFCINFCILFYIVALASGSLTMALWKTLLSLSMLTLFTALSLQLRRYPERLVQALTGLLAIQSIILSLCALPYILILSFLSETNSNILHVLGLSFCSGLLLIASIWLFSIYSIVYRSALELSINASYFLTLLLFASILITFKCLQ